MNRERKEGKNGNKTRNSETRRKKEEMKEEEKDGWSYDGAYDGK